MAIGELASMRKKVVSVSLLVISIIIAISIITIALYHWIPKTNNKNGKDCDENLLYSQYQSIMPKEDYILLRKDRIIK